MRWVPPLVAGATPNGEFDVAGLELAEPAPKGAKTELTRQIDDTRINAIVLLSDGKNHPPDQKGRAGLLDQIAEVTKARYYDEAINPTNIDEVMVSVFSNFS